MNLSWPLIQWSLGKILQIGENEGDRNVSRCYRNLSSWACDSPVLRAVAKTHKPPENDGCPKSRPIVRAARGLTAPLGELLSNTLEPVAQIKGEDLESPVHQGSPYKDF